MTVLSPEAERALRVLVGADEPIRVDHWNPRPEHSELIRNGLARYATKLSLVAPTEAGRRLIAELEGKRTEP